MKYQNIVAKQDKLNDFDKLIIQLDLELESTYRFIDNYNNQFTHYGNDIYQSIESHITHWFNYIKRDWFSDRLTHYLNIASSFDTIVDLGFSVPYIYTHKASLCSKYVFVDKENITKTFYNALVNQVDLENRRNIDFVIKADLDVSDDHNIIINTVKRTEPDSLLIVASEVVEHLKNPNVFWELVNKLNEIVPSKIYITLPVGKKIPAHFLEFKKIKYAETYISKRLNLEYIHIINSPKTNPMYNYLRACVCALGSLK